MSENKRNKINRNLDLGREVEKLRNMRITVIPIVVGALGILPKRLKLRLNKLEIKGRIETIQTPQNYHSFVN